MRSLRNYSDTFLLFAFIDGLTSAFSSKDRWQNSKLNGSYEQYRQTAYYLRRKGCIKITVSPAGEKFLQLTQKGEIELLMAKAWLKPGTIWDGKWRIVMFDIPEATDDKRDKLRRLLKNAGYIKLQASIYINPYPLNREAVVYLKKTGLINYIRIGRLEELDDDSDLLKHFKLQRQIKK
jgi:CRISPR-associated endonuclease Cas2